MNKIKVAVIGGSGYTGVEVTRILSRHPHVEIRAIVSPSKAGKEVSPFMGNNLPEKFSDVDNANIDHCDVIFACLPHGEGAKLIPNWIKAGKIVFDLSADFRLKNPHDYVEWYHLKHPAPELLNDAVYGLPEINRDKIGNANLIACPGCYATATILGVLPSVKSGIAKPDVFISAVSGTSGAGKKAEIEYSFCEVNENLSAYALPKHRHIPEMEQEVATTSGKGVKISFVPHLGPFNRGIYATITAELAKPTSQEEAFKIYSDFYPSKQSPFTHVIGEIPHLKNVRGTNFCFIKPIVDARTNRLIVLSALDNLVKGAGGQAVQCFNIRFGLGEGTGLYMGPT